MKISARSFFIAAIFAFSIYAQNAWSPEMQVKTKAVGAAQVSPDGKFIAVTVSDDPPRRASNETINIYPANPGGAPKVLAASFDDQPNFAGWSPDGRRIYFR